MGSLALLMQSSRSRIFAASSVGVTLGRHVGREAAYTLPPCMQWGLLAFCRAVWCPPLATPARPRGASPLHATPFLFWSLGGTRRRDVKFLAALCSRTIVSRWFNHLCSRQVFSISFGFLFLWLAWRCSSLQWACSSPGQTL